MTESELIIRPLRQWSALTCAMNFAVNTDNTGLVFDAAETSHPLAGAGKLFFGLGIAELSEEEPALRRATLPIRGAHRNRARTGTLRLLSGDMSLSLDDAVNLVFSTGDGASALALLDFCRSEGLDVAGAARQAISRLGLKGTEIVGTELMECSWGDGLRGSTTPQDLLEVLQQLSWALQDDNPTSLASGLISTTVAHRLLTWMSQVFEPAGLASALPGYGPRRVPHWTLSGWEMTEEGAREGVTSVMITYSAQSGWVTAAAFLGPWKEKDDLGSPRDVSAAMGGLGLSAYLNNQA